jgi:hypothetical protein
VSVGPSHVSMQLERAIRATRSIDIIRRYALGVSVKEIEALHECSKNTVLRYARLAKLPKRPKHFDAAKRRLIDQDIEAGKPIVDIAASCGCSQAYVSKRAAELGLRRYSTVKGARSKKAHKAYRQHRQAPEQSK